MPVPVTSSSLSRTVNKPSPAAKPRNATPKKRRVVRRRGRGNGLESDEEIEREVGTDSESEDDLSSVSSSSDSDTEPAFEDVAGTRVPRILTPNTNLSHENGSTSKALPNGRDNSFFASSGSWSEMVAEETVNGPSDLPVFDFSEMDGSIPAPKPPNARKHKKPSKPKAATTSKAAPLPSPPLSSKEDEPEPVVPPASAPTQRPSQSPSFLRRPGQSARQAYQTRLENDPSFVPTVGEFWGHDDRLLDKDLRSLSGWWRGRWQGGMRGRGAFRGGFNSRGRGGVTGRPPLGKREEESEGDSGAVPPVDRAWTHDGFEEMKKNEERRQELQQAHQQGGRGGASRGRGSFVPLRGRGSFVRGRINSSPSSRPQHPPGRVWYAMKPELVWTKQLDAFLYLDPALKPRRGLGVGYRVKFPGRTAQIIRGSPNLPSFSPASTSKLVSNSIVGSEYGDKVLVVKLPKPKSMGDEKEPVPSEPAPCLPAEEPALEDVFTVRPRLVVPQPIPLPESSDVHMPSTSVSEPPQPTEQRSVDLVETARFAQVEDSVLRNPSSIGQEPASSSAVDRPSLPPIETTFSPHSQGSPAYGSPYLYPVMLPPGIALNQHNMPYEVATGRPVYLPPPPMFTRPVIPYAPSPNPFVPGHISAVSGDFITPPASHTPPINGFIDPSTGVPMFSLPRQSSRVEIRAPNALESSNSKSEATRHKSTLSTAARSFEPRGTVSRAPSFFSDADSYMSAGNAPMEVSAPEHGQNIDPGMVIYPSYPQQYYYPDAYGYQAYMDMGQYEMYPPPTESQVPTGTVYYR